MDFLNWFYDENAILLLISAMCLINLGFLFKFDKSLNSTTMANYLILAFISIWTLREQLSYFFINFIDPFKIVLIYRYEQFDIFYHYNLSDWSSNLPVEWNQWNGWSEAVDLHINLHNCFNLVSSIFESLFLFISTYLLDTIAL